MLCFFNVTATTEIYTTYTLFPYTTRFRSSARGPRRERRSSGAAHLLRGVPAGASAAGGDPTGPAGGAADRRDRPRRRGIRGLPAGGAFRLPDFDSRAGHRVCAVDSAGGADLERHARTVGCTAAALPLPLRRLSDRGQGGAHPDHAPAAGRRAARPADRRLRWQRAQGGPAQG